MPDEKQIKKYISVYSSVKWAHFVMNLDYHNRLLFKEKIEPFLYGIFVVWINKKEKTSIYVAGPFAQPSCARNYIRVSFGSKVSCNKSIKIILTEFNDNETYETFMERIIKFTNDNNIKTSLRLLSRA